MIVDTSALVAIVEDEDERSIFVDLLMQSQSRLSAATWLETCLVLDNRSAGHARHLDDLISSTGIDLVAVSMEEARIAREAHRRFGRGSGSPANLNFGDCFAYALSVRTGEPLLFKGDDFTHTDIPPAWTPDSAPGD